MVCPVVISPASVEVICGAVGVGKFKTPASKKYIIEIE